MQHFKSLNNLKKDRKDCLNILKTIMFNETPDVEQRNCDFAWRTSTMTQ